MHVRSSLKLNFQVKKTYFNTLHLLLQELYQDFLSNLPPAAKTLFVKRVLDSQKLLLG
jgi:hypothetical protein